MSDGKFLSWLLEKLTVGTKSPIRHFILIKERLHRLHKRALMWLTCELAFWGQENKNSELTSQASQRWLAPSFLSPKPSSASFTSESVSTWRLVKKCHLCRWRRINRPPEFSCMTAWHCSSYHFSVLAAKKPPKKTEPHTKTFCILSPKAREGGCCHTMQECLL